MKRKILLMLLSCTLMLGLTACGHEHTWQEATCTTPKTCPECGETEGEVLEHTWTEATCAEAKKCTGCGEVEGEPLEHTWTEANYQQAKTCSVCEVTEGSPLEADFVKYNIPCDVVLDTEFEYTNSCSKDTTKDSMMDVVFTDYKCFVSDETHEAKEGYVWQTVTQKVTINDYNGWAYGVGDTWSLESYYNMDAHDASCVNIDSQDGFNTWKLSMNFNGINYNDCIFKYKYGDWENSEYWIGDFWDESIPRYSVGYTYYEFCVPEGSEGLVIALRNRRETGEYSGHFYELNNLDTIKAFRLPAAIPN